VRSGIDPAWALAFFVVESQAGTRGVARITRGIGNIAVQRAMRVLRATGRTAPGRTRLPTGTRCCARAISTPGGSTSRRRSCPATRRPPTAMTPPPMRRAWRRWWRAGPGG